MPIPTEVLQAIRRLGRTETQLTPVDRKLLEQRRDLVRNEGADWVATCTKLPVADHLDVLRGLVVAEATEGWSGGSVSPISAVFSAVEERISFGDAYELARWIVYTSSNQYIPFGGSFRDYFRHVCPADQERYPSVTAAVRSIWSSASDARVSAKFAADAKVKEARVAREMESAGLHATRKVALDARRRTLIEASSAAGCVERLELVVSEVEVPLPMFPGAWAEVTDEEIRSLEPGLVATLVTRLARQSRGPWAALRRRLLDASGRT